MRPLVLTEGTTEDFESALERVRRDGWRVIDGWDVPGGIAPGERVVCAGAVESVDDAHGALLAAVWGAGAVIHGRAERDVLDRLVDDLRRLGPLEHRTGAEAKQPRFTDEERALLRLLANGLSLGDAAQRLHISRRTADRRMASIRERLGVGTTAEALLAARLD